MGEEQGQRGSARSWERGEGLQREDQMERALISVPLNLAEGAYSRGKNRQARFQTAAASAREVLACWETAQALGWCSPMEPELSA